MNPNRIMQLEKFLQEDPTDPFTKYALALEHIDSQKEKSLEFFEDLLKNHSDYIGTYYHAAALYAEMNNRERAETIYQQGIEMAKQLQEAHALKELQSAYMNFLYDD